MPTDLKGLIERVESGANDRNLDLDIIAALSQDGDVYPALPGIIIRALQGSMDAVLALIEAKLPGMSLEVRRSGFGTPSQAMIWDPMKSPPMSTIARISVDTSPARALLAAALRAIQDSRT